MNIYDYISLKFGNYYLNFHINPSLRSVKNYEKYAFLGLV